MNRGRDIKLFNSLGDLIAIIGGKSPIDMTKSRKEANSNLTLGKIKSRYTARHIPTPSAVKD